MNDNFLTTNTPEARKLHAFWILISRRDGYQLFSMFNIKVRLQIWLRNTKQNITPMYCSIAKCWNILQHLGQGKPMEAKQLIHSMASGHRCITTNVPNHSHTLHCES